MLYSYLSGLCVFVLCLFVVIGIDRTQSFVHIKQVLDTELSYTSLGWLWLKVKKLPTIL